MNFTMVRSSLLMKLSVNTFVAVLFIEIFPGMVSSYLNEKLISFEHNDHFEMMIYKYILYFDHYPAHIDLNNVIT